MLSLHDVTLRIGGQVLLDECNMTIHKQQKVGVIGRNGCGKSSLFSLVLKKLTTEHGKVSLPKQVRIAHLAQETPALSRSALDYVLDGDRSFREIEEKIIQAEQSNEGEKLALLHEAFGHLDGYSAHARAAKLLNGLGFSTEEQQKFVKDFSGGWRIRLNLAQALMCPSDLLLLDEPTNHLDLDAVIWFEKWLKRYNGTLLLISHDRDFLDSTVDNIIHFEQQGIQQYSGNYSEFERLRAEKIALQQKMYEKQQKHRAHLQSFVDRFRAKASKAKQAQSRVKMLEKMAVISAANVDSPFHFRFREPAKQPNPLLGLDKISLGYGEQTVLHGIEFLLQPGQRIGLLGPNGAGKSTFMRYLAGESQKQVGQCHVGTGLNIGYFAQHQLEQLVPDNSPVAHLKNIDESITEQQARQFLGGFAFLNDKALSPIKNFSGGEKARLVLALLVWQKPNLLLLDEPTNHLDLDMRTALTLAIQEFNGAIVLVSHDRHLLRGTCDEYYLVANSEVSAFEGDLDDYEKWLVENTSKKKNVKANKQLNSKQKNKLGTVLKSLEKKIDYFQTQLHNVDAQLADPDCYQAEKKDDLQSLQKKHQQLSEKITQLEQEWLELNERLEK